MDVLQWLLGLMLLLTGWFAWFFTQDLRKPRQYEQGKFHKCLGVGLFTNFFDTLGIGSFAVTTAIFRLGNLVPDRLIPGTLNVGHAIPIVTQALIFITIVQVDILTLVAMIAAAILGALVGTPIVSRLSEQKVRLGMGIALLVAAGFMLAGKFGVMPSGGEATGLTGTKLAIGIAVNFVLGMLMPLGIGLYAPCMALVFALGMSPLMAFPIMMGSCAYLMPVASKKFIQEQAYDQAAAKGLAIGGVPGVLLAAYVVKSLPLDMLRWVVLVVICYTAVTMLRAAFYHANTREAQISETAVKE